MSKPILDNLDKNLIRLLKFDGRVPMAHIADKLGVTTPTVRSRMKALVKAGILQVAGLVNLSAVERVICADVNPEGIKEISDYIAHLDEKARKAGVAIMPECGLDPGIDLVLYGEARRRFDELTLINSYCGGFPEQAACDNPLNYKV